MKLCLSWISRHELHISNHVIKHQRSIDCLLLPCSHCKCSTDFVLSMGHDKLILTAIQSKCRSICTLEFLAILIDSRNTSTANSPAIHSHIKAYFCLFLRIPCLVFLIGILKLIRQSNSLLLISCWKLTQSLLVSRFDIIKLSLLFGLALVVS